MDFTWITRRYIQKNFKSSLSIEHRGLSEIQLGRPKVGHILQTVIIFKYCTHNKLPKLLLTLSLKY